MASTSCTPQKTKVLRPDRQGQAIRIFPNLGTLIEHGVFIVGDRFEYHEYTCKIAEGKRMFKRRITLSLHECPWLQSRLKSLEKTKRPTKSPPIGYLPSKDAPTQLLMSPSIFKELADWARDGYREDYEWFCRGAWTSKNFVVKTMGGREVREGISLGDVRSFFAEDVNWNYAMGKATCKPKVTCLKHFVKPRPESDFSRLLHYLIETDIEANAEEEDEDEDDNEDCLFMNSTRGESGNECPNISPQRFSQATGTSSELSITSSGDDFEGDSDEDDGDDEDVHVSGKMLILHDDS